MPNPISNLKTNNLFHIPEEFKNCINDLLEDETVLAMNNYIEHNNLTRLGHCIYVSYKSYLISKALGLDYVSAARGALLHDFYLYRWNIKHSWLHYFTHPYTALKNAEHTFSLNEIEKDIIVKHMWPLTLKLPKYAESVIVILIDKFCSIMELFKLVNKPKIQTLLNDCIEENK